MKILIVKLSALGDVVQSLAVLPSLKAGLPKSKIYWVVEESAAELVQDHPLINKVFVCPRKRWIRNLRFFSKNSKLKSSFKEALSFVKNIRSEFFDTILDLQGLLKSAWIVGISKGKRKLGFANHREGSTLVLTQKLPPYDPDRHAVDRYLDAAYYIGGQRLSKVHFPLPPLPSFSSLRKRFFLPEDFLVFIPSTRWPTKLWPSYYWSKLLEMVWADWRLPIIFVGAKGDKYLVEEILKKDKAQALSLCGQTSLLQLAGILKRARLVVSVDTGPMHLAVAVKKKVVAIFGPTAPWRTGPFGEGHRIVRAELSCSPCFKKECRYQDCMKFVTPRKVLQKINLLLSNVDV